MERVDGAPSASRRFYSARPHSRCTRRQARTSQLAKGACSTTSLATQTTPLHCRTTAGYADVGGQFGLRLVVRRSRVACCPQLGQSRLRRRVGTELSRVGGDDEPICSSTRGCCGCPRSTRRAPGCELTTKPARRPPVGSVPTRGRPDRSGRLCAACCSLGSSSSRSTTLGRCGRRHRRDVSGERRGRSMPRTTTGRGNTSWAHRRRHPHRRSA